MPHYSYRISRSTLQAFPKIVEKSSLIVFEDFESKNQEKVKDHFHGLLEHSKGLETVRKLFTKNEKDPLKGNEDYQIKICDDIEACRRYFFKGKDMSQESIPFPIVNRENLSERDYHKSYWQQFKEVQKLNQNTKYVPQGIKYWNEMEKTIREWSSFQSWKVCSHIITGQYKKGKGLMAKYHMNGIVDYLFMRFLIEVKNYSIECASKYIAESVYGYDQHYTQQHNVSCNCCQDDEYVEDSSELV